jgi:hypothetical protein
MLGAAFFMGGFVCRLVAELEGPLPDRPSMGRVALCQFVLFAVGLLALLRSLFLYSGPWRLAWRVVGGIGWLACVLVALYAVIATMPS